MDLQLKGKRALVTGSSSGIGAGVARMLAEEGVQVAVHGRDEKRTSTVAEELGSPAVIGDLSTDEGADKVADATLEALGGIDILVNNAGGAAGSAALPWDEVDEESWVATYQQNVIAAARMIRRLLPSMENQSWGRIIQIASAAASQPIPTGPDYGSAKAGMLSMTVSLAKHLGNCGITSNALSPGMILTPAVENWMSDLGRRPDWHGLDFSQIEHKLTSEAVPTPIRRAGRVEEVAFAVCMIASPKMSFMTGANLRVDGGQVQGVN